MASNQPEDGPDAGPPMQVYTTAALLLDMVDKKVSLTLRDGVILTGILRSFDQFGNFVLQDAKELVFHNKQYGEANRGVWIVRGETVALVGEIDPSKEAATESQLSSEWEHVDFDTVWAKRDADRDALEAQRSKEEEAGFRLGLASSKTTGNPYRF